MYYAVHNGTECYGSNTLPTNAKKPDFECNIPCPGNTTVMCGAALRNSIYINANVTTYNSTPLIEPWYPNFTFNANVP